MTEQQTDRQTAARETLASLARMRAESMRGGSSNFDAGQQPQIDSALRTSGMTTAEWESLCQVATETEADEWNQKLVASEEAAAELVLERRRNR